MTLRHHSLRLSLFSNDSANMVPLFKIVRISLFCATLAFSFIVLGLAAFFDHIMVNNDLTRYIPLAIFVAACTLTIIPTLLVFGLLKRVLLISQVRTELTFVGLLGLLWFVLGIYTAAEPDTVMTCDTGAGDFFELAVGAANTDGPYTNDAYQLQFQVLKSFAILNAVILVSYFLLLMFLAYHQHRMGRRHVWQSGITSYPFTSGSSRGTSKIESALGRQQQQQQLPGPVTAKIIEAELLKGSSTPSSDGSASPQMRPGGHYIMYIPPPPINRSR